MVKTLILQIVIIVGELNVSNAKLKTVPNPYFYRMLNEEYGRETLISYGVNENLRVIKAISQSRIHILKIILISQMYFLKNLPTSSIRLLMALPTSSVRFLVMTQTSSVQILMVLLTSPI